MQVGSIRCNYVIKKFQNHNAIKDKLIDLIDNQNSGIVKDDYTNITKSDWYVDGGEIREYWKVIHNDIMEHMDSLREVIREEDIPFELKNFWFQQYSTNDNHTWHTHPGCQWSSCYYLELPHESQRTILKDALGNIIIPEVKEGDILTFPSSIMHTSPVNNTPDRKTIIAWNIA